MTAGQVLQYELSATDSLAPKSFYMFGTDQGESATFNVFIGDAEYTATDYQTTDTTFTTGTPFFGLANCTGDCSGAGKYMILESAGTE